MTSKANIEASMLYRGVNRAMHDQRIGLHPRNSQRLFRREVSFDGTWKCEGSVIFGNPTSQAVHSHQRDSEAFNGPGLSFSTIVDVAKRFATTNGLECGVIYVVGMERLLSIGCAIFDPCEHTSSLQNPDEAELIVVPPVDIELTLADMERIIEVS